ncbi:hypothetical protein [Microbacterium sp. A93]|uniref:hypothetical protein n=1 Tax=Microbacterium sp. A93 TaxID=3450716 RepID=UPI003F42DD75
MTLTFRAAYDRYATSTPGASSSHRAAAHLTARFLAPNDPHAITFRVPTPEHVARFGIVKSLERAGLTHRDIREVREAVHTFISGVYRRHHGPLAYRTPKYGREHLAEDVPVLDLSKHYRGLQAALNFTFDADHPDNAGLYFDRWDYEEAIISATLDALRTRADDAARNAACAAAREAREQRTTRPPQPTTTALTDEQRARYRATAQTKRVAEADAQLQTVTDTLAALIDDGELAPGARLSRAELTDMVRAALSPSDRSALAPRRTTALILQAAASHSLAECVLSSGNGKRTRGFVYTPQTATHTAQTTHEQPEEAPVNLTEQTTAMAPRCRRCRPPHSRPGTPPAPAGADARR